MVDISNLPSWLKLPQKVLWALLIINGLILWGPPGFLEALGLQPFINEYRNYLGVAFLLLLAATLPYPWEMGWNKGKKVWNEKRVTKLRIEQLQNLTPQEKAVLRDYIDKDSKSQELDAIDGVTVSLKQSQIIYQAANLSKWDTHFAFNIQPWAWNYLKKNRDVLDD